MIPVRITWINKVYYSSNYRFVFLPDLYLTYLNKDISSVCLGIGSTNSKNTPAVHISPILPEIGPPRHSESWKQGVTSKR